MSMVRPLDLGHYRRETDHLVAGLSLELCYPDVRCSICGRQDLCVAEYILWYDPVSVAKDTVCAECTDWYGYIFSDHSDTESE